MGKGLKQHYPCTGDDPYSSHYAGQGLPGYEGECVIYACHRAEEIFGSYPLQGGIPSSVSDLGRSGALNPGGSRYAKGETSPTKGDVGVNCYHSAGHAYFFETTWCITHSNYRNPGNNGSDFIQGQHGMGSCVPYSNISDNYPGDYIFRFDGQGHQPGDEGDGEPSDEPGEDPKNGKEIDGEITDVEVVIRTHEYTDIIECNGKGQLFENDSGTQDLPAAPTVIHPGGGRDNERGEPFNMYTYERTLTYKNNYDPNGSDGIEKYNGQDYFSLGKQPSYGNGGEMDGDDERE